jgi:RNA polymerase sigma-70 factor (ECF subfamily)
MNSSEDLIERACAGDQEAFRLLFERYACPILSFIYDLVLERDLAEELTQETFVRAYQKLSTLRDRASFSTWLFGIGRNVSREALRLRSRRGRNLPETEVSLLEREDRGRSPADELFGKELNQTIRAALRSLDEDKRLVFTLRVFQQRSYDEIAQITGFSLSKVKTDLRRARAQMRQRIRPLFGDYGNEM